MSAASISRIKSRLLATPSLINVRQAAIRIIATRHKCSEALATSRLYEFKECAMVDEAFKRILPLEYKREKGSIFDRRYRFFAIMRDRFPVDWESLDQCYMEGEPDEADFFDYGIIILSMRPFDSWEYRSSWDKLPLAYRVADALLRPEHSASMPIEDVKHWAQLSKTYKLSDSLKPKGKAHDEGLLFMCFEEERTPLKYLPLAAKVLSYNTGCVFFDFDEDGPEPLEWSQAQVEWLTGEAKVGKQIEAKIKRLDDWLRADPQARVAQACRLYQKFQRVIKDDKSKFRIKVRATLEARPLVDVL